MPLDLGFVRSQFPALADGVAYMDNAGGSLVLKAVAERVADYLLTSSVQIGATYTASELAAARLGEARRKIARLINAERPEEVVLNASTTVNLRFLATAMASSFGPGDEIVLTGFDHESNIGPWLTLRDRGVVFKHWGIDHESFEPSLDALEDLLSERTRLVCVTHASNILGSIMPIKRIAEIVHARGAKICVDGVAYAPHRAVNVRDLDVDYYAFSFYKTYGPHFAVLYGKFDQLLELDGLYHYFYGKDKLPAKLEPGNTNYELAWGCTAIVDYLDKLGGGGGDRAAIERAFAAIADHEAALSARLLDFLTSRNDVRIIGSRSADQAVRVPTISFKIEGQDSAAIVRAADAAAIGIRHGDFASRRLVESLGLAAGNGVIRASMVHYNSLAEVDRLMACLESALA
jgi:cysteine desulfurase family protein (TIGR01976 family)